jgi:2,5-dioxopentanoate dehydrogenase
MFSGLNYIGYTASADNQKKIKVFSTRLQNHLPEEFSIATTEEIEQAVDKAKSAFEICKKISFEQRSAFLETIAEEIINTGDSLIQRAMLKGQPQWVLKPSSVSSGQFVSRTAPKIFYPMR